MRSVNILVVIVIGFVFIGCNTSGYLQRKYLGKTVDTSDFSWLTDPGPKVQSDENYDVEFDYVIDEEKKTIRLTGTYTYNRTADESTFHSETVLLHVETFEARILFADMDGKITGAESIYINTDSNIFDPIPFAFDLPYSPEYKKVYFAYSVFWKGG